ncbi:50S ribosomal protein L1 [Candidatus Johnevansia muelleri]|uniref:Large ribosomal subunit protein uL1 n=1 Tax=Candidatus Johnevansia muelleri TaxID=1495769 RepID=A0A078KE99_9GAMM|nr:50S ribosomal protein L1 [Candidatus Evansia muelleri]
MKKFMNIIDYNKLYNIEEATTILNNISSVKFKESIDVAIKLGVDPRKSDQLIIGSVIMPHGTGKPVRIAVFAKGSVADAARLAGAEIIGMNDLADKIKSGKIDFDVVIASPDTMRFVSHLGSILGPRGLMPNTKYGTVTGDVTNAVKKIKSGQIRFRTDKNGIIHASIGKLGFSTYAIKENIDVFIDALKKLKPSSSKGIFIKKVTISTTMGPGITIDHSYMI